MHRAIRPIIGIVVVLLSIAYSDAAAETFPRYDLIKPNVDFWTDIYTRYTSRQAVVHDSHDLSIVYEVIDLKKPYGTPGARKAALRFFSDKPEEIVDLATGQAFAIKS